MTFEKIMNITNERRLLMVAKIAIVLMTALLYNGSLGLHFMYLQDGLDPSWTYSLNCLNYSDMVFGKDILFTLGPLGYILCPMPIGTNVARALGIMGTMYFIILGTTVYLLFSSRFAAVNTRLSNILMAAVLLLFVPSTCLVLPEYYTVFFVLTCFAATLWQSKIGVSFYLALFFTVFSMFVKFSTGLLNLALAMVFVLAAYICKREDRQQIALYVFIGVPALFAVCYLWYNPNFADLVRYVYGAVNISSGYTYNMSMPTISSGYSLRSNILLAFLSIFMIYTSLKNKNNLIFSMLFAVPIFIILKHAYVRGDHIYMLGPALLMCAAIFTMFMPSCLKNISLKIRFAWTVIMVLIALIINIKLGTYPNAIQVWTGRMAVFEETIECVANLPILSDTALFDHRQKFPPQNFRDAVGDKTVTFYPWNYSYYRFADQWQFIPIPVFPINAATPYLDNYNSDFFSSDAAPFGIVLEVVAVDEQFPLISNPHLWQEIFRHYEINQFGDEMFLLTRRQSPLNFVVEDVVQREFKRTSTVNIPKCEHGEHIIVEMNSERNLRGKLAQIFYKIPEVTMTVTFADGNTTTKRVILEVWQNGVIIDSLPNTDKDFAAIMTDDAGINRVVNISFGGAGLKYYAEDMKMTFKKVKFY